MTSQGHRSDVEYDTENFTARWECRVCCTAGSGPDWKVEQRADAHERETREPDEAVDLLNLDAGETF